MTRRKLLRVVEIAEILGVSKQRADQLRLRPTSRRRSTAGPEAISGRLQTFVGGRPHTRSAQHDGVPEGDALSDSNEIRTNAPPRAVEHEAAKQRLVEFLR
jgi:hypothetical protein